MFRGGLSCVVLSRGCCRDVSVLFQWCFSDVLVMFFVMSRFCLGGVSVMSRWCPGFVSVMCRSGLGDVSVMCWSCLGDALVICRWCLWLCVSDVFIVWVMSQFFRWCLSSVSMMSWWCFGDVSVRSRLCFVCVSWMIWWYLGDVSVILWWCVKMFSACASDVLVIFKGCVGDVLGVSRWCVVIVLWCFGDMWMMPWFCVGDVSALCRWCFGVSVTGGDAAVMFWSWFVMFRWRTLMSIFRFSVGSDAKSMAVPCVFAIGVVCWANLLAPLLITSGSELTLFTFPLLIASLHYLAVHKGYCWCQANKLITPRN